MDDQKISEIKSQLEKLKSLEKDGLLPSDVYKQATALATLKYLNLDDGETSNSTFKSSPANSNLNLDVPKQGQRQRHDRRRLHSTSVRNEVLWAYGGPLLLLMFAIICSLIMVDWILGVDTPRLVDYMLNPFLTVATHRTGRG